MSNERIFGNKLQESMVHYVTQFSRRWVLCDTDKFGKPVQAIVNRGDCLWSPTNIKGTNKDAKTYVGRSTTLHNSPLQKRAGTGASFLYWLDWESKHQLRSQGLFSILSAGPVLKIGKRPWERGCLNIKTEMLMNEKLPDQVLKCLYGQQGFYSYGSTIMCKKVF